MQGYLYSFHFAKRAYFLWRCIRLCLICTEQRSILTWKQKPRMMMRMVEISAQVEGDDVGDDNLASFYK